MYLRDTDSVRFALRGHGHVPCVTGSKAAASPKVPRVHFCGSLHAIRRSSAKISSLRHEVLRATERCARPPSRRHPHDGARPNRGTVTAAADDHPGRWTDYGGVGSTHRRSRCFLAEHRDQVGGAGIAALLGE
jgi:hypothetical protein